MRPTRGQDGLSSSMMTLVCYNSCSRTGDKASISSTDCSQVLAGSLFNKTSDLESLLSSLRSWDQNYKNPIPKKCQLISSKLAFEKRPGLPLDLCTVFELILELKRKGWQGKQCHDQGRKKKILSKLPKSVHDVQFWPHTLKLLLQLLCHIHYGIH